MPNYMSSITFCTHVGFFRYKRTPFGIYAASKVYQRKVKNILQVWDGVVNIADDNVVHSTSLSNEVVIVKNGQRICGSGGALGNAPIVQNKAYFEVKLQQSGIWGIGVATYDVDLNKYPLGDDQHTWVLCHDATLKHGKETLHKLSEVPQEGDIISVTYDHIEMNFYLNGSSLQAPVHGIKGTVYPFLFVDDGAILDAHFSEFMQPPPSGFDGIMIEQSLL
ncbi:SPRY domain-containing protein 7 [Nymphon striatum]|nr:SPRY domain-containing protein 7 [Nymphon striatum]